MVRLPVTGAEVSDSVMSGLERKVSVVPIIFLAIGFDIKNRLPKKI